jgi:hypothetical protein
MSTARRLAGRVRRKLRRVADEHRAGTPAGRVETQLTRFSATVLGRFDEQHRDIEKLGAQVAGAAARMGEIEKRSIALSNGLQDLTRRAQAAAKAAPARPRPSPVTEENVVLTGLQVAGEHPRVVIVLHSFEVRMIFAGVRTAFVTAVELARLLHRPLALVVLEPLGADPDDVRTQLIEWLSTQLDAADVAASMTLSSHEHARRKDLHADDIWLATYWTTAFQLGRLCDDGLIDPDHVVYLVQDWEPGFFPWGTEYALASSTYARGFHLLVNSASLAAYVTERTGVPIPADQIIAPQVDEERLRAAAKAWQPGRPDKPRVLFYARPSKPRNTYVLGLAALRIWADALPPSLHPVVTFAGEELVAPDLGPRVTVRAAGNLSFDAYYDLLAHTDVGLTLMHSPHPSHLALELPMAGIPAITNALDDHRQAWLPGLDVAPATPHALAEALAARVSTVGEVTRHEFVSLGDKLGRPLDACLDALVTRLPNSSVL